MNYFVEVFDIETEEVVKSIPCATKPKADRVMQGVFINLNHSKYDARVVLKNTSGENQ